MVQKAHQKRKHDVAPSVHCSWPKLIYPSPPMRMTANNV